MTTLAELDIATHTWTSLRRGYLAESLEARACPECGSPMTYREYAKPHFNPRGFTPAVVFGRLWCGNYGGCEYASG